MTDNLNNANHRRPTAIYALIAAVFVLLLLTTAAHILLSKRLIATQADETLASRHDALLSVFHRNLDDVEAALGQPEMLADRVADAQAIREEIDRTFAQDSHSEYRVGAEALWTNVSAAVDGLYPVPVGTSQIDKARAEMRSARDDIANLVILADQTASSAGASVDRTRSLIKTVLFIQFALAAALLLAIVLMLRRWIQETEDSIDTSLGRVEWVLSQCPSALLAIERDGTIARCWSYGSTDGVLDSVSSGQTVQDMLRPVLTESRLEELNAIISDLSTQDGDRDLRTEINLLGDDGMYQTRVVELAFRRDIRHQGFLLRVDDITRVVEAEARADESERTAAAQFDLLLQVSHVRPSELRQFVDLATRTVARINNQLGSKAQTAQSARQMAITITEEISGLSKAAEQLEFQVFVDTLEDFRTLVEKSASERSDAAGEKFIPVALRLEAIMREIDLLRILVTRLGENAPASALKIEPEDLSGDTPPDEPDVAADADSSDQDRVSILRALRAGVARLAEDENKYVRLHIAGESAVPATMFSNVIEIVHELVRNAVIHGIETLEDRALTGKPEEGLITVRLQFPNEHQMRIVCHDDGRGIHHEVIARAAAQQGLIKPEAADRLDPRKAIGLVFQPGFSTRPGERAGGGLHSVARKVNALRGKLKLRSTAGSFTEFQVILPVY